MSEILFHYQKINPTTWVYVSSLLMFGLFFQFNRFWSVRNLDLVLLILLAPGLLMVNEARDLTKPLRAQVRHDEAVVAAASDPESRDVAAAANVSAATEPSPATAPTASSTIAHDEMDPAERAARRRMAYNGYVWLFSVSLIW